jgi:putative hydrolase of the HAD superfamily
VLNCLLSTHRASAAPARPGKPQLPEITFHGAITHGGTCGEVPHWRVAKVLLIDLDGVVRDWDPSVASAAEQRHGLPPGCIEREAFAAGPIMAAVTGRISDEDWRSGIAAGLAARHGPAAWPAVREWSAPCGRVNPAVLELVRQQRRTRRVALLSNATSRLPADLARLGLDTEFDAVFSSAVLGVAKPDTRAFRAVLRALACHAADCLFVDDTAGHVLAAAGLGLHAHHFRSAAGLAGFLADPGIHPHPRGSSQPPGWPQG